MNISEKNNQVPSSDIQSNNVYAQELQFKKPTSDRMNAIKSALKKAKVNPSAVDDAKVSTDEFLHCWQDASHSASGIESFSISFVNYRGSSLSKLDQKIKLFNQKEWETMSEKLVDMLALKSDAQRHLVAAKKRQFTGRRLKATQMLIQKLDAEISAMQPTVQKEINQDINIGEQYFKDMSLKMNRREISLFDGISAFSYVFDRPGFLERAAEYLVMTSNEKPSELCELFHELGRDVDTELIDRTVIQFVGSIGTHNNLGQPTAIMSDALTNISSLVDEVPSLPLILHNDFDRILKNTNELDDVLIENKVTLLAVAADVDISDEVLSEIKQNEQKRNNVIEQLVNNSQWVDFDSLIDDGCISPLPIIKAYVQSEIAQSSKVKKKQPSTGVPLSSDAALKNKVRFIQHYEAQTQSYLAVLSMDLEATRHKHDIKMIERDGYRCLEAASRSVIDAISSSNQGAREAVISSLNLPHPLDELMRRTAKAFVRN